MFPHIPHSVSDLLGEHVTLEGEIYRSDLKMTFLFAFFLLLFFVNCFAGIILGKSG